MGPGDGYLVQYSKDVSGFWASTSALELKGTFQAKPGAPVKGIVDPVRPRLVGLFLQASSATPLCLFSPTSNRSFPLLGLDGACLPRTLQSPPFPSLPLLPTSPLTAALPPLDLLCDLCSLPSVLCSTPPLPLLEPLLPFLSPPCPPLPSSVFQHLWSRPPVSY